MALFCNVFIKRPSYYTKNTTEQNIKTKRKYQTNVCNYHAMHLCKKWKLNETQWKSASDSYLLEFVRSINYCNNNNNNNNINNNDRMSSRCSRYSSFLIFMPAALC